MSQRQIVLDTETTGISVKQGHRIIEIGAIEMIDRRPTRQHFHSYLNPERDIEPGAFAVHGISSEFLRDKPKFKEVAAEFLKFIGQSELIIHNAPFDVSFLDHELRLCYGATAKTIASRCAVIDSLLIARQKHPGKPNNLDALCKRYEIDNTQRDLHGALKDANLLLHVYLRMTGGQGNLFASDTANNNQTTTTEYAPAQYAYDLPVILPTQQELAEHALFEKILSS